MNEINKDAEAETFEQWYSKRYGYDFSAQQKTWEHAAMCDAREVWKAAKASAPKPAAGQCGESCERAKLCGACARGLEEAQEPVEGLTEQQALRLGAMQHLEGTITVNLPRDLALRLLSSEVRELARLFEVAFSPAPSESEARDAKRYRWLRRGGTAKLDSEREEMVKSYGDHYLDEAIDAAMSAPNQNGGE